MPHSQNGWPANDRSLIDTFTVPGTDVRLPLRKGDAAVVLLYVAARWHREVERLIPGHCWGYAERPIRGSITVLSNHASGTAADLDAPEHPLGTAPEKTFSAKQIRAIHRIIRDPILDGVIRWGGDYQGRKDPMHIELNAGERSVAQAADRIRAQEDPMAGITLDDIRKVVREEIEKSRTTDRVDRPSTRPDPKDPQVHRDTMDRWAVEVADHTLAAVKGLAAPTAAPADVAAIAKAVADEVAARMVR